MAKSTQVYTDAKTVRDATPTTTSVAKYNAATGPITDVPGMTDLLVGKIAEIKVEAQQIKDALDAGDPIVTTLQQIIDVMV